MNVSCPECQNACSDKTPSCPKCGHALQEMTPSQPTPIQSLASAAKAERARVAERPDQTVQPTEPTEPTERAGNTWRRVILPAMAACLLGVATCSAGVYDPQDEPSAMSTMGAVLALAGFLGVIVAKIGAWRNQR